MKITKPNITEGKWKYINPNNELGICLVNTEDEQTIHDGFDMSNAKAISAVHDMIDALIDFVEHHTIQTTSDKRRLDKAINALKKAGCTYEH